MPTNVLLLTVDDLNYNSTGLFGCQVEGITPHIDQLAKEGMVFRNSHVTIAVCQPSRSVLMTGRYPHRNGARGFEEIDRSVTTLTERLREYGYRNGIIGKETHLAPADKFAWDEYIHTEDDANDYGRSPQRYYEYTKAFLQRTKSEGKPFFLMVNSHDPHRPFANSDDEFALYGRHIPVPRVYTPEEITVPGFLPDIPQVRLELSQYFMSVRRCDETVGQVLRALREEGQEDNTFVLFLSDNGMALPFAKTNCYLNSTKSPWIARWPGKIPAGAENHALVSSIDYAPTVLDLLGIPAIEGMDGTSLRDTLIDDPCCERSDVIYTQFHKTVFKKQFPMRCVQNKRYAYIYNGWSDGECEFRNESMSGLTFKAMKAAAETDEAIAKRVDFYLHRVPEELYDYQNDPDALNNLIDDPAYKDMADAMRKKMLEFIEKTGDNIVAGFAKA